MLDREQFSHARAPRHRELCASLWRLRSGLESVGNINAALAHCSVIRFEVASSSSESDLHESLGVCNTVAGATDDDAAERQWSSECLKWKRHESFDVAL